MVVMEPGNAQWDVITAGWIAWRDKARDRPGVRPADGAVGIHGRVDQRAVEAGGTGVGIGLLVERLLGRAQVDVRQVAPLLVTGGVEDRGTQVAEMEQR